MSRPFPRLIEQFLLFLAAERGLSTNYRISVQHTLERFADWCAEREHAPETVNEALLATYHRWLRTDCGLAASSCRVAMVHLRQFFRYLAREKELPANPAALLECGRAGQPLPETLGADTVNTLLQSIDPADLPYGARDRAILEMLYGSGLRVSELVNLRADQVDWEENFLRITGKGNKTRYVPLGGVAARALRSYLQHARPRLLRNGRRAGNVLFLSNRQMCCSSQTVASASPATAFSRLSRNEPGPPGWRKMCTRISCAIPLLPTCSKTVPTCA